jgi:hypothetical protein
MHAGRVASALAGAVIAVAVGFLVWNTRRPASVEIAVEGDQLVVRMRGLDVVYCCRRQLVEPLAAVAGVCVARRDSLPTGGLRLPGTAIPGVIRAGSYGTGDDRDFWDVRRSAEVLVIQMTPGAAEYRRIIVEVPDPHSEMIRLRPTLGASVLPVPGV